MNDKAKAVAYEFADNYRLHYCKSALASHLSSTIPTSRKTSYLFRLKREVK